MKAPIEPGTLSYHEFPDSAYLGYGIKQGDLACSLGIAAKHFTDYLEKNGTDITKVMVLGGRVECEPLIMCGVEDYFALIIPSWTTAAGKSLEPIFSIVPLASGGKEAKDLLRGYKELLLSEA